MEIKIYLNLVYFVIFIAHTISCNEENAEETFRQFYSCYFAKYFSLPSGQAQPQLVSMVDTTVKESLELDKKVPTQDCMEWICDQNLQWKRTRTDRLEIWAYFAEEESVVDSWEGCYQDELEGFRESNYSVHEAGGYNVVLSLSGNNHHPEEGLENLWRSPRDSPRNGRKIF